MISRHENALPLVVAVTGHRDLVAHELDQIKDRVRGLFTELAERCPTRKLTLMSSLAEGSDQLAAEIALELGIELIVPLPMPRDLFLQDFKSVDSVGNFEAMCKQAADVFEVHGPRNIRAGRTDTNWTDRDLCYAQLGVFLAAHCHVLLALWDGKASDKPGGTGHVVKFHHDDVLPGYTERTIATQQMLVDDESDLIYHIVCSRDRPDGTPRGDLQPLDAWWFTKDEIQPRSREIPPQHETIFQRSGEFSQDAIRYAEQIEKTRSPLLDVAAWDQLPIGIELIDRFFCVADWLAIRYQRKTLLVLRLIHLLAFIMGMMFILYSDFAAWQILLIVFLISFVIASGLQYVAKQRGWHRKYLDYRALAEGLRVQFYWATAGVTNVTLSKFTHDSFLQAQDPEVGWIRNVMRVAGMRVDAQPHFSELSLETTITEWIGSDHSGQLGYFRDKAKNRITRQRVTEAMGQVGLGISAIVVIILLLAASRIPQDLQSQMMVLMGTMLLVFAIRHSYATSIAEKELIRQYEFMLRVFRNSSRRLDGARDQAEKRQILLALGGAALDEQAEWILKHRERSIDKAEIWRMGS